MKDIVIIGAGGFGREVKVLIDAINEKKPIYNFLGYFDDGFEKGSLINGFKVLGQISEVNNFNKDIQVAIAVGTPKTKEQIVNKLQNEHIHFPTLIHPSVIYSTDTVTIGKGAIICAGCIITCNIVIHDFVILNLMCSVGHDTVIKEYTSIMPGVNISGEVLINSRGYIGTGAKIINQLEIGTNTTIGAGAVVSKSIPSNCIAVGVPARVIKQY